ncbi:MAG: formylglycine-generating enzyme family protein [Thermoguttaceae bacterium]|jgi:formylglycine-generating enzyme required for sulfatase activity
MFRQLWTLALGAIVALGSHTLATAQESKEAGGKVQSLPKEVTVDLGNAVKLEMVLIPLGEFKMGSPDSDKDAYPGEKPQHRVRITKPFYLGKYLVTQKQWETVMGNNPSRFQGPQNPVEKVSWEDCQQFLDTLNTKFGVQDGKFQLPSEAEWEYACRAGTSTKYCFGDEESGLGEYAWYDANSSGTTHAVGKKKPNAWGLYDMHGNVWEWCRDGYNDQFYTHSPPDDPAAPATSRFRVIRGGGWYYGANTCRSASRYISGPGFHYYVLGLRVCRIPAVK